MSRIGAAGLLCTSMLLTGCGSTVAMTTRSTVVGSEQGGLDGALSVPSQRATTGPGGLRPGTTTSTAPVAGTPGGAQGGGTGPSAGGSVVPAPGGVAGTVKVGIVYDAGTDSYAQSFGLGFLSTGDGRAQGKAYVDHLNAHGGLAGRRIVPVFAPMETAEASSSGADQAQASVCAALTQDDRVAFAVGNLAPQASFLSCLHKAGVPYVTGVASLDGKTAASVAPDLYLPGGWLMGRVLEVELERLIETGFLSRSSKVGLMHYDTPDRTRVANEVALPLLKRHGIPVVATGTVAPTPDGNARFAGMVLTFQSAGVDRVVEVSTSPLLFMQAAESQQYRPKYVIDSLYGPGAALQGQAPANQLAGAQGIGWEPLSDLDVGDGAGTGTSSERTCRAILQKSGQTSTNPVTRVYQLRFCDSFLFLAEALRGARGHLDGTALAAGARALGTRYVPAATFRSDFSSGRPDGAAAYRDLRYDGSCSCFRYAGGTRLVGP